MEFLLILPKAGIGAGFVSKSPSCTINQLCATAHHWARELMKLGHTVRLIPSSFLQYGRRPYMDPIATLSVHCGSSFDTKRTPSSR
jgi:hypothetical protein